MLYLDTSALAKLCKIEAESAALEQWLEDHPAAWVTSAITEVELTRSIARAYPAGLARVPGLLQRCDRLRIDERVRTEAAALEPSTLRSLDAIHLATALELSESLDAFLVYDKRLGEAAEAMGLTVEAPA